MLVLDCQLWIEKDQRVKSIPKQIDPKIINPGELKPIVKYICYKKPMASMTANKESNGLPDRTKISTAVRSSGDVRTP